MVKRNGGGKLWCVRTEQKHCMWTLALFLWTRGIRRKGQGIWCRFGLLAILCRWNHCDRRLHGILKKSQLHSDWRWYSIPFKRLSLETHSSTPLFEYFARNWTVRPHRMNTRTARVEHPRRTGWTAGDFEVKYGYTRERESNYTLIFTEIVYSKPTEKSNHEFIPSVFPARLSETHSAWISKTSRKRAESTASDFQAG